MDDMISRQALLAEYDRLHVGEPGRARKLIEDAPSAQPEYEPAKLEDFAKTMSANTLYSFMAWYGEGLELMERHGFVICKKTM